MAIKYWTGSGWVSQDGSATTPPAVGDTGVLGGTLSGITLPQSGGVSFFGLTAQEVGTLMVVGTGPWTIAGTGGTGTTIDDLTVAMGASVTADSTIAVKDVVIQQVPGVTAPAFVNLADGLATGDTIDFHNQRNLTLTRPPVFDGTNTNEAVSSADGTKGVATIVLAGNVQFSGQPVGDGNGGSKITVTGTQPSIAPPFAILMSRGANDIGLRTGESVQIGDQNVVPNGGEETLISVTSALNPATGQPYRTLPVGFDATTAFPNGFDIRITYDPTNPADAYMLQPWTMTFTNGASTLTTSTPSLVGVTPPPFPTDVRMSGNSEDPTFTWSYPTGSIDGVLINLRDDSAMTAAGGVDIVFSTSIPGTTGTFTIPTALDGGFALQVGHHYTFQLIGVVSRDPTLPLSNHNTAASSQSFFDFEPTGSNGGTGDDTLNGGAGNDTLNGFAGNDTLNGGAGNDVLNGGVGADVMSGGTGNDTYYVDNAGDTVTENPNEGTDTVKTTLSSYTLGPNVENLTFIGSGSFVGTGNVLANIITGGAGNDTLTGGGGNDTLIGGNGNDVLNGGAGADVMSGGAGNDVYYVDNAADKVNEAAGQGTDTVYASVSYTLTAGSEIEYLRANAGATGLTLTGNALNNTIVGGTGNDTLNGGTGADTMAGGPGNDTYYVDNPGDVVNEAAGAGTDTVKTTLLSEMLGANLENLTFIGSGNFTGTGNALNNVITGGAGNDTLNGGAGNDTLNGGNGNDVLVGGTGADVLTGGAGADVFRFTSLADSTVAAGGRDTIRDFASGDKIDLHLIDANASLPGDQAFSFIGTNAFSGAAGQLRYAASGGNTLITGDVNGDRVADFSILVSGAHAFSGSDFVR